MRWWKQPCLRPAAPSEARGARRRRFLADNDRGTYTEKAKALADSTSTLDPSAERGGRQDHSSTSVTEPRWRTPKLTDSASGLGRSTIFPLCQEGHGKTVRQYACVKLDLVGGPVRREQAAGASARFAGACRNAGREPALGATYVGGALPELTSRQVAWGCGGPERRDLGEICSGTCHQPQEPDRLRARACACALCRATFLQVTRWCVCVCVSQNAS